MRPTSGAIREVTQAGGGIHAAPINDNYALFAICLSSGSLEGCFFAYPVLLSIERQTQIYKTKSKAWGLSAGSAIYLVSLELFFGRGGARAMLKGPTEMWLFC